MDSDKDNPKVGNMIVVYETDNGWRYRVGRRDDGNYATAAVALECAEAWLAGISGTPDNVRPAR